MAEGYLEELSVIIHQEVHQSFTARPSQFMILNKSSLKAAAHQDPVVCLNT